MHAQSQQNLWKMYDELIEGIDENLIVTDYLLGAYWSMVATEESRGVALTVRDNARPFNRNTSPIGMRLKEVAQGAKSWNFSEACLGMAAINCFYNSPHRLEKMGVLPHGNPKDEDAFTQFMDRITGKKVCVIGHFPHLERIAEICELSILERNPQKGDYPDSACEFILPEQDYVFITGLTFTNKTIVRLLQIIPETTHVIMVGPTVPASDILFRYGINSLSCFSVLHHDALAESLKGGRRDFFSSGLMFSYNEPSAS